MHQLHSRQETFESLMKSPFHDLSTQMQQILTLLVPSVPAPQAELAAPPKDLNTFSPEPCLPSIEWLDRDPASFLLITLHNDV